MIYLDVTGAATSRLSTGIQRATRGIHRALSLHGGQGVVPLVWDNKGRCYTSLSNLEKEHLERPFGKGFQRLFWPDIEEQYLSLSGIRNRWTRPQRRIAARGFLDKSDTLLITDLCWDSRADVWSDYAKETGLKVAIFHDAMPLRITGQNFMWDGLFKKYVKGLASMDLVICVSQESECDLVSAWKGFGISPKPTKVITWPVPFEGERSLADPVPGRPRLLYVSRLLRRKNHFELLEACEMLWREGHDFSLDLIGTADAPPDTLAIISHMARLALVRRRVRWLRHVSDLELAKAYQDCTFTVFPSRMEGFGLPIMESLWYGKPVICGGNGALGEVSSGGGCLVVDQNNPDNLAAGIRLLLMNQERLGQLREEAKNRSFRRWEDYALDLKQVLLKISS
ncbi:MAG: glycosyltransferase [Chthoniobacterales bacterium]